MKIVVVKHEGDSISGAGVGEMDRQADILFQDTSHANDACKISQCKDQFGKDRILTAYDKYKIDPYLLIFHLAHIFESGISSSFPCCYYTFLWGFCVPQYHTDKPSYAVALHQEHGLLKRATSLFSFAK